MEQEILRFLEQAPGVPYSVKEISKRLDRDRFRTEPSWARPYLKALLEQDLVEEDLNGCYLVPRI